jgi:hypothetical protein
MNIRLHAFILLLLLAGVSGRMAHAQNPDEQQIKIRNAIINTMESLGKIKVKEMDVEIPATVKPLLTELKHELIDLISYTMNDDTLHWKSPDDLKTEVLSRLRHAGVNLPKENDDRYKEEERTREYTYNQINGITIESPVNYKNLLVVTTTLWVMCGEDTSFYVFKKEKKGWELLLSQEAKNYDDIKGAHEMFGYSISPTDKRGGFFIVTANVNPWCTSNWQRIRYSVMRAGKNPYKPKTLLEKSDTIYLGVDPPVYKIKTEPDRFKIEFRGDWYFNPDKGASPQYAVYRVAGDKVSLIRRGRLNK